MSKLNCRRLAAWSVLAAFVLMPLKSTAIDDQMVLKQLVFSPLFTKNGQVTQPSDTGQMRTAFEITYEQWFKEISYHQSNPTNGVAITRENGMQGWFIDTKSYGYSRLPWGLGNPPSDPANFSDFADITGTAVGGRMPDFRGEYNWEIVPAGVSSVSGGSGQRHTGSSPSGPLLDDYWTPGERFFDENGNGSWTLIPERFGTPYWNADVPDPMTTVNTNGVTNIIVLSRLNPSGVGYTPVFGVGMGSGVNPLDLVRGGELFADYSLDGIYGDQTLNTNVVDLWINVGAELSNRVIRLNELDLTPTIDTPNSNEGDVPHTYNNGGDTNLPDLSFGTNACFDFFVDNAGETHVYPARRAGDGTNETLFVTFNRIVYIPDYNDYIAGIIGPGIVRFFTGSNYTDVADLPFGTPGEWGPRQFAVPVYQSSEILGTASPFQAIGGGCFYQGGTNVLGYIPADPEPFDDFVSWWEPYGGVSSNGIWIRGVVGHPSGPLGTLNDPFAVITWTAYQDYINNNYPGNAAALLARAGNGVYDGPDDWFDVGNNKMQQFGEVVGDPNDDGAAPSPQTDYDDPTYQAWDPYNIYVSYDDWWADHYTPYSTTTPTWYGTRPVVQEYDTGVPQVTDVVISTNGAFIATNAGGGTIQFDLVTTDAPESIVTNVIFNPGGAFSVTDPITGEELFFDIEIVAGPTFIPRLETTWEYDAPREFDDMASSMYHESGDMRLGEATDPISWLVDGGRSAGFPSSAVGPYPAGPMAYTVHGDNGFLAGNNLTMELITWRRDGFHLTGPTSVHPATDITPVAYAGDHRDVNINGLIDQGETVPAQSHNYFRDGWTADANQNGMDTTYPFNWERLVEDLVEAADQWEDFDGVMRQPLTTNTYVEIPLLQNIIFRDGAMADGTISNVLFVPGVPSRTNYDVGDVVFIDQNANSVFDGDIALLNYSGTLDFVNTNIFGNALTNVLWRDNNSDGVFQDIYDDIWQDVNGNGVMDSEVVLYNNGDLHDGMTGWPINGFTPTVAMEFRDNDADGVFSHGDDVWMEGYLMATNGNGIFNAVDDYAIVVSDSATFTNGMISSGQIANVYYRNTGPLGAMIYPQDPIWIETVVDATYSGEPVLNNPYGQVYREDGLGLTNGTPGVAFPEIIAYQNNGGTTNFEPSLDDAWIDYNGSNLAGNLLFDFEPIIEPIDDNEFHGRELPALTFGNLVPGVTTGLAFNAPVRWVDNQFNNSIFDVQWDNVWVDGNSNSLFDAAAASRVPLLYVKADHIEDGNIELPGIYHSGVTFDAPTRDNGLVLSGWDQVQPGRGPTGLFCHEQHHDIIPAPDLYDYDRYDPGGIENAPVAEFDLMSGGGLIHNLPSPNKDTPGWIDPYPLETILGGAPGGGIQTILLYPVERNADQYIQFLNQEPTFGGESYYFWYQSGGSQFSGAGGQGLHIEHEDVGTNPDGLPIQQRVNNHFTWQMVQADGLYELEDAAAPAGPDDVWPGTTDNRLFTQDTIPWSRWWDQADSGLRIYDVRLPGNPEGPLEIDIEWVDPKLPWTWPAGGIDADADGIPDAWEIHFFTDITTVSATSDWDTDGLSDLGEYLAQTNPDDSSPGTDASDDPDGDGLSNLQEVTLFGTNPVDPDTDDDGFWDGDEINSLVRSPTGTGRRFTSPVYSRAPLIQRSLAINGTPITVPEVQVDIASRFELDEWTIETWAYLDTGAETGDLISREVRLATGPLYPAATATNIVGTNYVLGVSNNIPFAAFTTDAGNLYRVEASNAVSIQAWTHLAATWNSTFNVLRLYVDGVIAGTLDSLEDPFTGLVGQDVGGQASGLVRLGGTINGYIDETRIWDVAREGADIADGMLQFGSGYVVGATALATPRSNTTAIPKSYNTPTAKSASALPEVNVPATDVAKLRAADKSKKLQKGIQQYAVAQAVDIAPDTHGEWESVPGGDIWRVRVTSQGATDLNLAFDQYNLPAGATLHILSEEYQFRTRAFTAADNKEHGELWTPVIPGSSADIELFVPTGAADPELHLQAVNCGYLDLFKKNPIAKQGSCNVDVICPEGDEWRDEIRSVARYSLGGTGLCTGSLVMDADATFTPFFLTAAHCGINAGNAASMVVYWNYESDNCGDLSGGSLAQNQSGATFLASRDDVDMSLVQLDASPDPSFNVYFSGWDRSGSAPGGSVGIHHPNGDQKAISFNTDALTTSDSCIGTGTDTHWLVDNWEIGTTEPGSSGSGLWDPATHLLVGFLSGGAAACGNTEFDCYGKFSVAWDGASADQRLKDWLDPADTGAITQGGANPGGTPDDPDPDPGPGPGGDAPDGLMKVHPNLVAWFPYDDNNSTAEDYVHMLDWQYALGTTNFSDIVYVDMQGFIDTDDDGIPDWWELLWFGGSAEPTEDPDGDGLTNLEEYQIDTNPNNPFSTGTPGGGGPVPSDGDADSDGDSLTNFDEINIFLTDPLDPDTDDDGFSDGDEINWYITSNGRHITDPNYSRSPVRLMSADFTATNDHVILPQDSRFNMADWTVQGWLNPTGANESGSIIRREVTYISTGTNTQYTFNLGLTNGFPIVEFTTAAGVRYFAGGTNVGWAVPVNGWTHLAGTMDTVNNSLSLYVNGVAYQAQMTVEIPAQAPFGETTLGYEFDGYIDDVMVYQSVRTPAQIAECWNQFDCVDLIVTTPSAGLDLVFLVDVSGSMSGPIDELKANISSFVTEMEALGIDAQIAGVRYSDTLEGGGGGDTPPSGYGFTATVSDFLTTWLNPLPLEGGGDFPEDGLGGITYALESSNFAPTYRDGAQKMFILVTDADVKDTEDGDTGALLSMADVIAAMNAAGVTLHTITDATTDANELAAGTGGLSFDIASADYSAIFDTIASGVEISEEVEEQRVAWYVFDDTENTTHSNLYTGLTTGYGAEDYIHPLNWSYSVTGVVFSANAAPITGIQDADGDGLPDWYEEFYSTNTTSLSATNDLDGDGLNNLAEYELDTNPNAPDTNNDGINDGVVDTDGDGLSDLVEYNAGLDPMDSDTDDDGLTDGEEIDQATDPLDSSDPYVMRYVHNDGTGWIEVPGPIPGKDNFGSRFDLTRWTVEAAVRLEAYSTSPTVIARRQVRSGNNFYSTFELGIETNGIPYTLFHTDLGTEYRVDGFKPVELGRWSTIAGRFGDDEIDDQTQLALFHDGTRNVRDTANVTPIQGVMINSLVLASNLVGDVDDIRIWRVDRVDSKIMDSHWEPLLFGTDVGDQGSLFSNGGNLQRINERDVLGAPSPAGAPGEYTVEAWINTEGRGTIIERLAGVADDGENIYNYRISLSDDTGQTVALFDVEDSLVVQTAGGVIYVPRWGTITLTGSTALDDGEWHHVALVYTGGGAELYVDGVLEDSVAYFLPVGQIDWHLAPTDQTVLDYYRGVPPLALEISERHDLAVGEGPLVIGDGFPGLIDEVGLHSEALDEGTIRLGMFNPVNGANLMSYFSFDSFDSRTSPFVFDSLFPGDEDTAALLQNPAAIVQEPGDNAPLNFSPILALAPTLAAYFPFDDGRASNQVEAVEDFMQRLDWDYAGVFMPSNANIDFASFATTNIFDPSNPFVGYESGIVWPTPFNPFFVTEDTPWRIDADGDLMPDAFEQYYDLMPNIDDPGQNPELAAFGDVDGDGLVNLYEYYAGTDPTFHDSDADGVDDGEEDSDGDGVANIDEQGLGTHPGRLDSDDDGHTDGEEVNLSHGADSMDPLNYFGYSNADRRHEFKSMVLDGSQYEIPRPYRDERRFNSPEWTVEAWVYVTDTNQTGSLIEYVGQSWTNGAVAQELLFYRLGLSNGIPYVAFESSDAVTEHAVAVSRLPAGEWTHLAGVFSPESNSLNLYRNGVSAARILTTQVALSGSSTADAYPGRAYIGDTGLLGNIDEVRLWSKARSQAQVQYGVLNLVSPSADGLIASFRFDDGRAHSDPVTEVADGLMPDDGKGAEDFTQRIGQESLESPWRYAMRGITFDYTNAVLATYWDFDDEDYDDLADWWEGIHFNELLNYRLPIRNSTEGDPDSVLITRRLTGREDSAFSAVPLGWTVDFTPMFAVIDYRWTEAPDTAWIIRDVEVPEGTESLEIRLAVPAAVTRMFVNGQELALSTAGITAAQDTFNLDELENVFAETYFIPHDVLEPFIEEGRNRFSFEIQNGNSFELSEYFNIEIVADSDTYLVRRGDDPEITNDDHARWLVLNRVGSVAEPSLDNRGLAWWEQDYALDTIADIDADTLINRFEMLVRSNPYEPDSDGDGILDIDEDFESDGLSDFSEQQFGTDPRLPDTDDDGLTDLAEIYAGTDPTLSISPLVQRVADFPGTTTDYIEMPNLPRFGLNQWTIEAWVRPRTYGGNIIHRDVEAGVTNYFMSINGAGNPVVGFGANSLTATNVISTAGGSNWTHLAMSYSIIDNQMNLYVNGVLSTNSALASTPRTSGIGPTSLRIGDGYDGAIEEIRIWSVVRTQSQIDLNRTSFLTGLEDGLLTYYRFDDSSSYIAGVLGTSASDSLFRGQVEDFGQDHPAVGTAKSAGEEGASGAAAGKSLPEVPEFILPGTDVAKLLATDKSKKLAKGVQQFAVGQDVDISPDTHGEWSSVPGGDVWKLRLTSQGATDLNLGFDQYNLPDGATLRIISEAHEFSTRVYTSGDNKAHGQLWTPVIPGESADIELYVPTGAADPQLHLASANCGYRDVFGKGAGVLAKQGDCNIDVICSEGNAWRNEIRSVGAYSLGGTLSCTGTLIMDADATFTPFFLTAAHCGINGGNAASMVVYWNFESANCGDLSGGSLGQNQSGATFLASRADVDVCLVQLDEVPDAAHNVYYSGWDRSGNAANGSVGIHHPNVDEKAISINNDTLTTSGSCIGGGGTDTHWLVDNWETGTTEPGSSGSGIWDPATHLLVGFLSGGAAACGNTEFDCYGKFSVAWDGAAPTERLKDWLDPNNSGALTAAGANPGAGAGGGAVGAGKPGSTSEPYTEDWKRAWQNSASFVGSPAVISIPTNESPIIFIIDTDGDGMPDWWEDLYASSCGLDRLDPTGIAGAAGDPDNDGINNLAEYNAGSNPCVPDIITINPDPILLQVGDTLQIDLTREPFAAATTQTFNAYSSDGTLFVVNEADVTFATGETDAEVTVTGVAISEGLQLQTNTFGPYEEGQLYILSEDGGGIADVYVYNGEDLRLSVLPGSFTNVVAGDTLTVVIERQRRTGVGRIESPLTVNLTTTDPDFISLPATVTIPAGTDVFSFPVAGICPEPGVTIYGSAVGYPIATLSLDVINPDLTILPDPVTMRAGDSQQMVLTRDFAEVGAELTVELTSSDPTVFEPAQNTVTFAATESLVTFTLNSFAGGGGTIAAQVCSYAAGGSVNVTSNALDMTSGLTVVAGDNATMSVTRFPIVDSDLVVTISSSDPSTLTTTNQVIINASEGTQFFEICGVTPGAATVQSSAPGFISTNTVVTVTDPDLLLDGLLIGSYQVEVDGSTAFNIWRPLSEAGCDLSVSIGSTDSNVFTFAGGSTNSTLIFLAGETNAVGTIYGGAGGTGVSNATLSVSVGSYVFPAAPQANVQLIDRRVRLDRIDWIDTDASENYSEDDVVVFVFNSTMNPATVTIPALELYYDDPSLGWQSTVVADFGGGSGIAISNRTGVLTNSMFAVTLGSSPVISSIYGVNPANSVLDINGAMDETTPPVRFPTFSVGSDTDNDGLPDIWESDPTIGLDPFDPTGDNGTYGDPDNDGLINLYEYFAGLNPRTFDTFSTGADDYCARFGGALSAGELYDDTDQLPDEWEALYPALLSPLAYDAGDDPDGDGWRNIAEYLYVANQLDTNGNIVAIRSTDPTDPADYPVPTISGVVEYLGAADGDIEIFGYQTPDMDGDPVAQAVISNVGPVTQFTIGPDFFEGDVYLMARINDDVSVPINMPDTHPVRMTWAGVENVFIGINDPEDQPWYPYLTWTDQATPSYYIRLYRLDGGKTLIGTRWIDAPRNFLFEQDYRQMNWVSTDYSYGLATGSYEYQIATDEVGGAGTIFEAGTFSVFVDPVIQPSPTWPVGAAVVPYAQATFRWSSLNPVQRFQVTIRKPDTSTETFNIYAPYRDGTGGYEWELPILFGDTGWGNGEYEWRIRMNNGTGWGNWASWETFIVGIVAPPPRDNGAPSLQGEVFYCGLTPSSNIVVEAYRTFGYSGSPASRLRNISPGDYELFGLRHLDYFVIAYIDVDGDGELDEWEPQGYARDKSFGDNYMHQTHYAVGTYSLSDRMTRLGVDILIRDRDTDNDNLPDGWEMMYFASLSEIGTGDPDSDGMSNLDEYLAGTFPASADSDSDGVLDGDEVSGGTDPLDSDSDGDTIPDGLEVALGAPFDATASNDESDGVPAYYEIGWDGNPNDYNPYDPILNPTGTDLDVTNPDTDGDGVSDLEEIAAGSDPLNPGDSNTVLISAIWLNTSGQPVIQWPVFSNPNSIDVTFNVEYSSDMISWIPLGAIVSDGDTNGNTQFTDVAGTMPCFYRLVFTIEDPTM